ncbi:MAG: EamA family transporter [Abditibacteriota bacterium]|nr:EamA family transporter [Abditibacteriota bacterium]
MDLSIFPQTGLLVFSLFVCLVAGLLKNYYSKSVISTRSSELYLYSAATAGMSAVLIFAFSGFRLEWSVYTVLMSVLFGFVTMLQNVAITKALVIGPYSYTCVLGSAGTMISALSGYFFFGEVLTAVKIAGMAFMLVCFALSVKKDEDGKKGNLIWFLLALTGAVTTGVIGLLQKIHQNSPHKNELLAFLVIAFVFSYIFSQIFFLFAKRGEKKAGEMPEQKKTPGFVFMLLAVSALCIALNNIINLFLSGVMEAAVFFPVVNGVGLILSILFCMLLFREKLQPLQWVGVVCGVISTLLLCMP